MQKEEKFKTGTILVLKKDFPPYPIGTEFKVTYGICGRMILNTPYFGEVLPNGEKIPSMSVKMYYEYEDIFKKFGGWKEWFELKKNLPLFITEDGVEVYKKNLNSIWWVNIISFEIGNDIHNIIDKKDYLFFSKEDIALSYIISNKPIFSLNDVKRIICSKQYYKEFKEFAKKACGLNN